MHHLHIDFAEGIVTLSGTVNHLLAKERAVRIAETVKGVRAVGTLLIVSPIEAMAAIERAES